MRAEKGLRRFVHICPSALTHCNKKITTRRSLARGFSIKGVDQIPVGKNAPDDVNVIIEVPIGGEPIKYELDKAAGTLVVDRFLHTPLRYPGNHGFVPP